MKSTEAPIDPQPANDLAALLAPISVDRFFAHHFARRRLVIQRRGPGAYAGLPLIDDFEQLLASLPTAKGSFSVVHVWARPPEPTMLTPDGAINLAEVFAAYRSGHSLLLHQVQHRHRATGQLCRALEGALIDRGVLLGRHIGANAYLSPPRSQGFSIHYDAHDVLVLQLSGSKTWRLYGQPVRFPTAPPPEPITPADAGPLERELVMSPGDLLYLPRGVLHEARANREPSLHLTLSIAVVTWRDLLVELCAADPRLGEGLPVGFAQGGVLAANDRARVKTQLHALVASRALPSTVAALGDRLHADLAPLPTGGLARIHGARAISARTWLALAPGTLARVHAHRDEARLQLAGAAFSAGRHMAPVFRMIARGERFRAAELPGAVTEAEKLALARKLYASGHVMRVPGPGPVRRRPGARARPRHATPRTRARR